MDHPLNKLKHLFNELALRHGISNLALTADGTAGLQLRDGIELNFEYVQAREKLFAYTSLIDIPGIEAERLVLFQLMLEMNCLEQDTFGGILALDSLHDVVICQLGLDVAGLTLERLDHAVQELLEHRLQLLNKLKGPPSPRKRPSSLALPYFLNTVRPGVQQ